MGKTTPKNSGAVQKSLTRIAPFLLPAIFFQSAIFAVISPLPLFLLCLKNQLWVGLLAFATNLAFIFSMGSQTEMGVAALLWFSVGVFFPFLIRKSGKIELSFFLSFVYFSLIVLLCFFYLAAQAKMPMIEYLKTEVSLTVDHIAALPESPIKKVIEEQGRSVFLKQIITELPSAILITMVVTFWLNLLFASQLTRGFLSKTYWSKYKNAEWLIWPTLLCAALLAFADHAPYYFGLNGFKLLMVFYGFQGLSIISHLLNRFKIVGFGRTLFFSFAIFVTWPLVLSMGFFDLWFDFRRKFGQS